MRKYNIRVEHKFQYLLLVKSCCRHQNTTVVMLQTVMADLLLQMLKKFLDRVAGSKCSLRIYLRKMLIVKKTNAIYMVSWHLITWAYKLHCIQIEFR